MKTIVLRLSRPLMNKVNFPRPGHREEVERKSLWEILTTVNYSKHHIP